MPLSRLNPNAEGTVNHITDESKTTLKRIEELGLKPGVHVRVMERNLRNGSVTFQTGAERRTASPEVASAVQIKVEKSGVDLRVHREVEKWNHKTAD